MGQDEARDGWSGGYGVSFLMGLVSAGADHKNGRYNPGLKSNSSVIKATIASLVQGQSPAKATKNAGFDRGYASLQLFMDTIGDADFLAYCKEKLGTADPGRIALYCFGVGGATQAALAAADMVVPDSDAEDKAEEDSGW